MINYEKLGDKAFIYVMISPILILALVLLSVKGEQPNQYVYLTWYLKLGLFAYAFVTLVFVFSMIFYSKK